MLQVYNQLNMGFEIVTDTHICCNFNVMIPESSIWLWKDEHGQFLIESHGLSIDTSDFPLNC